MDPNVRARYKSEERAFIADNKRDVHYDFEFFTDVPFTLKRTLVYQPLLGQKPLYASYAFNIFLEIFVLGWI